MTRTKPREIPLDSIELKYVLPSGKELRVPLMDESGTPRLTILCTDGGGHHKRIYPTSIIVSEEVRDGA